MSYGRICARFDLEVGPIRLRDCNLITDRNGHAAFVMPGAVKGYRGEYQCLVELDRDFRSEVFDAVTSRLQADVEQSDQPQTSPARDAWAEDQEARLERAIAELDGAA